MILLTSTQLILSIPVGSIGVHCHHPVLFTATILTSSINHHMLPIMASTHPSTIMATVVEIINIINIPTLVYIMDTVSPMVLGARIVNRHPESTQPSHPLPPHPHTHRLPRLNIVTTHRVFRQQRCRRHLRAVRRMRIMIFLRQLVALPVSKSYNRENYAPLQESVSVRLLVNRL